MPSPTKGPRLGGGPAHERLILANLATALFEHDAITTTEAKAKRLRPLAERLITFAKRGDLHARRRVMTVVRDKGVVHRLFVEIAPDMAAREGGYTRIIKISARKGDNAPMAVIELVREPVSAKPKKAVVSEAEGATKRAAKDKAKADKKAADVQEAPVEDAVEPFAEAPAASEVQDAPVAEIEDAAGAARDDAALAAEDAAADTVADDVAAVAVADTDAGAEGAAAVAAEAIPAAPVADLTDTEPVAATKAAGLTGGAVEDAATAVELPAGAVAANADGSAPAGYTVKGNADSGLYHVPGSQWYDATEAEFWFADAAAAEAAGFKPAGGAAKQQVDDAPAAFVEAEYGAGSAEPNADGSAPAGHDVKGNKDSMLFHVPGSQWYDATEAEVWFADAAAAEAAGFKPAGGAAKQQVDED